MPGKRNLLKSHQHIILAGGCMFYQPILMPLLCMVLLTFLVWVFMYVTRLHEINSKGIHPQKLATRAEVAAVLTQSAAPADNLKNLFEMPVLFYVVTLLSLVLLIQDETLVWMAWLFTGLRALHSIIHCTYNITTHRFIAYLASSLVLFAMWIRVAVYVVTQ
jgi:hypothetical protein